MISCYMPSKRWTTFIEGWSYKRESTRVQTSLYCMSAGDAPTSTFFNVLRLKKDILDYDNIMCFDRGDTM